jgi:hypothetical protein
MCITIMCVRVRLHVCVCTRRCFFPEITVCARVNDVHHKNVRACAVACVCVYLCMCVRARVCVRTRLCTCV